MRPRDEAIKKILDHMEIEQERSHFFVDLNRLGFQTLQALLKAFEGYARKECDHVN